MKANLTLAFALLLICTGTALASTPDGTPPSGETVCDGQTGAAYGLCTAFCEAMDCDSDAPQASQNACDKVGAKFLNITGQAPPCVAVACPCVAGVPGFLEALDGQSGLTSCERQMNTEAESILLTTGDGRFVIAEFHLPSGTRECGFFRGTGPLLTNLSQAEAEACIALVREKAAAASLTCTPF